MFADIESRNYFLCLFIL